MYAVLVENAVRTDHRVPVSTPFQLPKPNRAKENNKIDVMMTCKHNENGRWIVNEAESSVE